MGYNKEKAKEYYQKNKDKVKKYQLEKKEILKKIRDEKKGDKSLYDKNYQSSNKQKRKEYLEKNKEVIKQKRKEYYQSNKKVKLEKQKNYNQNNKERILVYQKQRYHTDLLFRLKTNIKNLIGNSIRNSGFKKLSKTEQILGCSFEQFKIHLESKFESWMNWDNRGLYNGTEMYGWDIDHIIPLDTATCEADILRLNHYTNLQPLCSYVNRDIKRHIFY